MATISIFSTEAMASESNEKAAAWLKENVADLQPMPAEITSGQVKLNFNTGFLQLIDLICGFCFSRRPWHYACGV
jgi:hypothetical protein